MAETFTHLLLEGGKSNSLGRAEEVVRAVLHNKSRLGELYDCLFEDDEWVRMRAADSLEKVCRVHPEWFEPYVERFLEELTKSNQPSIQWHLAQMLGEIDLTSFQKQKAISWLSSLLQKKDVDWIVAANTMETLSQFAREGSFSKERLIPLLKRQQKHRSNAVVKRATKLLHELVNTP